MSPLDLEEKRKPSVSNIEVEVDDFLSRNLKRAAEVSSLGSNGNGSTEHMNSADGCSPTQLKTLVSGFTLTRRGSPNATSSHVNWTYPSFKVSMQKMCSLLKKLKNSSTSCLEFRI